MTGRRDNLSTFQSALDIPRSDPSLVRSANSLSGRFNLKFWLVSLWIALCTASSAAGADSSGVAQRVRVVFKARYTDHILYIIPLHYAVDSNASGTIVSWSSDSLILKPDSSNGSRKVIAASRVTKFYVADGRKCAVWSGMKWGTAVGLVVGLAFAVAPSENWRSPSPSPRWEAGATITAIGTIIGGAIGLISKEDRWRVVQKAEWPISAALALPNRGVSLSVRIGF